MMCGYFGGAGVDNGGCGGGVDGVGGVCGGGQEKNHQNQ